MDEVHNSYSGNGIITSKETTMKFAIRSCRSVFSLALAGIVSTLVAGEVQADDDAKYEARFTADGKLIRPEGWREWVFVGSPLTPNSLNGGEAPFPEFHTVYIDPKSWAYWNVQVPVMPTGA